MPISLVQKGLLAEYEFVKDAILGSDGEVEVSRPATDDDRRDADVHRRGDFQIDLGFQVKSSMAVEHPWAADRLHIRFIVRKDRLMTHPLFYYFFAFLDPHLMRFADPVFIIPSAEVHQHAIPHLHGDAWHFDFHASLGPRATDRWGPFRVAPTEIGKRILAIIAELERNQSAVPILTALPEAQGQLWVRRAGGLLVRRQDAAA